ncbi:MAG: hypothetical protein ACK5H4_12865 [Lacrimispora sphenoides]
MPLPEKVKRKIYTYCNNQLADGPWYETQFDFIQEDYLRTRIIKEFRAIRFAYKLYEGIAATDENLIFEVRNQILAYATIYEAVIQYVLYTYYKDSHEFYCMTHHTVPVKVCIPEAKLTTISRALSHDGKDIVPFYYKEKEKENTQIRFDSKCRTANQLGLLHSFVNAQGDFVDLPSEIIEVYGYRNGIHLAAEQRKGIVYELDLSKLAYWRMQPFIDQIKEKLHQDEKY